MALALLIGAQLAGLLLMPLGLPGLWLMLAAGLATLAEILELTLTARYTKKYGGSSRAGWGALFGGLAGAFMGVPIPIVGSVIGAFAGGEDRRDRGQNRAGLGHRGDPRRQSVLSRFR